MIDESEKFIQNIQILISKKQRFSKIMFLESQPTNEHGVHLKASDHHRPSTITAPLRLPVDCWYKKIRYTRL